jgi:hypothetical protein
MPADQGLVDKPEGAGMPQQFIGRLGNGGDVEGRLATGGRMEDHLQAQCGLSRARRADHQQLVPLRQAATQDPIQIGHTRFQ